MSYLSPRLLVRVTPPATEPLTLAEAKLYLGNLKARRDWGFAPEYVTCQWLMMQQETPNDYVIGTGESHTVEDFAREAFAYVNLDWQDYVQVDAMYFRPTEADHLCSDMTKAKRELNWSPKVSFGELVKIMMDADLRAAGVKPPGEGERILRTKDLDWIKGEDRPAAGDANHGSNHRLIEVVPTGGKRDAARSEGH